MSETKKKKLTKARANELFNYNSVKRQLTWKRGRGNVKKGDLAGETGMIKVDGTAYDYSDVVCIWVHGVTLGELNAA